MSNFVKWISRAVDWMSRPRAATVETLGHPAAGVIGWIGGNASASGIAVTEDNAYDYSPVFACTRILATSGGDLPCRLMLGDQDRKTGSGGKKVASQHPVHWLVHQAPNSLMSCSAFFRQGIVQQVNSGNSFSEIERDGSGSPVALWPINSSRVQVKRNGTELVYLVHLDGGRAVILAKEDVLHVAYAPSLDGISGMGVIANARETIGAGMAAERHAGYTFANGAVPRTVLQHPKNMSKDARANLREEWQQLYGGTDNAGKTAVLWEGMTLTALSVNNADAQFLETRKFNATEVARWYGVPPHMIGDLERATFSNIEHQGRSFVQTTLRPLINPWQDELDRKLLTEDERKQGYYVYFDYDEWQRGDMQSRALSNQINLMNGFTNQDEVRASEDKDPLPNGWGQKFYIPANLMEVGKEPEPVADEPVIPVAKRPGKPVEGGALASSDDQPRDDLGRFGEGGGGDSGDDDSEDESDAEDAAAEALQEARDTEDSERQDARDQEDSDQEEADGEEDSAIEDARSAEDYALEESRSQEDSDREDARQAARDSEDEARQEARDAEDSELEGRHESEMDAKRDVLSQQRSTEDKQRDADRDAELAKENADFNAERAPLQKEYDELPDELDESQQARADEIGEELERVEEKWNAIQEKREVREEKEDEKREASREKEDEKLEERGEKELEKAKEKLEKAREKEDEKIQKARDKEDEKGDPELDKAREKQDAEIAARREKEDGEREKAREKRNATREGAREEEDKQIEERRKREDAGQPVALKPRLVMVAARSASEERLADCLAKARSCFEDTIARMIKIEQREAIANTATPARWFKWLCVFYGEQEARMASALEPMAALLNSLGESIDVQALCREHCKQSHDLLVDASDALPENFKAAVETLVAGWAERANIHKEVAHV